QRPAKPLFDGNSASSFRVGPHAGHRDEVALDGRRFEHSKTATNRNASSGSVLQRGNFGPRMSLMGLGGVKTLALLARVESSRGNCASWSQIILRAWRSMPCWRIAFSTFRRCMSFHTARVKSARVVAAWHLRMSALLR